MLPPFPAAISTRSRQAKSKPEAETMAGASKHQWSKAQKHTELMERLEVLKTAWNLGNGDVPQPWFKKGIHKKVLLSRLEAGFAAFAAEPAVKLPVGLQDAIMTENFDFESCLTKFGLTWEKAKEKFAEGRLSRFGLDWAQAMKAKFARAAKKKAKPRKAIARESCKEPPNGYFFKYDKKMYQDVNKFCDHHEGMKKCSSKARKVVVNTEFPKSAYLVVPGHSKNNYRWIPADWKNGITDLSEKKDAAYVLEQGEKPTGAHILLVSMEELTRAAARALSSHPPRKRKPENQKTQSANKRPKEYKTSCGVEIQ